MFWWFPVGGKGMSRCSSIPRYLQALTDRLFRLTEHRSIGPDLESHEPPWFCVPILRVVDTRNIMETHWKAGTKAVHLLLLLWVLSRGGQKSRPYSLEAVYATRGGINILGLPIGGNLLLRRVDTFVRRDER